LFERQTLLKITLFTAIALFPSHPTCAQDLAPRAYLITPLGANAITLASSFFHGGLDFNGVIPVENATGTFGVGTVSYYRSFDLFGRSANVAALLPYGLGKFKGDVSGQAQETYRSGLLDAGFRLSVNLKGGPAMSVRQFATWKQGVLLGASLKVITPTGQYDPNRLINWGANRWAFKPEFGYSQRFGNWILDGYAGVWLFTTNDEFFSSPAPKPQKQSPIGALEGHLSYNVRPFLWVSLDGNFWYGGATSTGGVSNPATRQTGSRLGVTASLPITRNQTLKLGYSDGAYSRFGASYKNLSIGWQYSWLEIPK
jgi:hypothetical protein